MLNGSFARNGRSCRYDAANECLQSALADFLPEKREPNHSECPDAGILDGSMEPDINNVRDWRSEPRGGDSEVSSHICKPKWHRLLRAVASLVSDQIHKNNTESGPKAVIQGPFACEDAGGGGSPKDLAMFLSVCLQAIGLDDKETGYILIDAYHHLQAADLPLCSQSWRTLVVTAVLAATNAICKDDKAAVAAVAAVQKHVAHWWSFAQAVEAYKAFICREEFQTKQLSPSRRADIYFELRDLSLRMGFEEESNASAVNMFDLDSSSSLNHFAAAESLSFSSISGLQRRGGLDTSFEISVDSEVTSTILSL